MAALERTSGRRVVLRVLDNTVVGVAEPGGAEVSPGFTLRAKRTYDTPPKSLTTRLRAWDHDTYRLAVDTPQGAFCISNRYEMSDYQQRVRQKLEGKCPMAEPCTGPAGVHATLMHHPLPPGEDGGECLGELEDIHF